MKISKKILTTLVVAAIAVAQPAFADAEVNAKFLASKTYSGNKEIVYQNGNTELSEDLWSAKIPTKIKIYKREINVISFKFKSLIPYSDIEDIRIEIALWSKAGKPIADTRLFDWNPTGGTTIEKLSFFNDGKIKAGSYFWLITTYHLIYEGKGEIRVPLTIQY